MNNRRRITRIAVYFLLSIVALCFLFPTVILILRSLNFFSEQGLGIISLGNYSAILLKSRTIKTFLNGFIISFTQSVIVVVLGFISAFALARMKKKLLLKIQSYIFIWIGIPLNFLVIPVYFILQQIKLLNSLFITALFFTACALPFTISILTENLLNQPEEALKSAELDGANFFQILVMVILPESIKSIITVGLNSFIVSWTTFIVPFILINSSDKQPVSIAFYEQFSASYGTNLGELAAFAILYTLPIWIIYFISYTVLNKRLFFKNIVQIDVSQFES